jgi:hypothetical protein
LTSKERLNDESDASIEGRSSLWGCELALGLSGRLTDDELRFLVAVCALPWSSSPSEELGEEMKEKVEMVLSLVGIDGRRAKMSPTPMSWREGCGAWLVGPSARVGEWAEGLEGESPEADNEDAPLEARERPTAEASKGGWATRFCSNLVEIWRASWIAADTERANECCESRSGEELHDVQDDDAVDVVRDLGTLTVVSRP